jgi:hypothetical protein
MKKYGEVSEWLPKAKPEKGKKPRSVLRQSEDMIHQKTRSENNTLE